MTDKIELNQIEKDLNLQCRNCEGYGCLIIAVNDLGEPVGTSLCEVCKGTGRVKEVDITPNYKQLFNTFIKDAERAGEVINLTRYPDEQFTRSDIHSLLASLNVAINAISSTEDLNRFRDVLGKITTDSLALLDKEG